MPFEVSRDFRGLEVLSWPDQIFEGSYSVVFSASMSAAKSED